MCLQVLRGRVTASLIAAAPETAAERDRLKETNSHLLAALKRLHCIVGANCCTCDDCRGAEKMALEAIRKAEGELSE